MHDLIASLIVEFRSAMQTDVFRGAASAGLVMTLLGAVLYQCRAVPGYVMALIRTQFTVTLTIHNDSSAFHAVSLWLSRHPDLAKARRLTVAQWWSRTLDRMDFALTAGEGRHLLRHNGAWMLLERTSASGDNQSGPSSSPQPSGATRREQLTFTVLGRSQAPYLALLTETAGIEEDGDTLPIYLHGAGNIGRRMKRSLDTIYLDADTKADILADVERFVGRRSWYADRGIPYRRGYMLSGPPGTGKSSFIFALASHLNRPLHIVNPATISHDSELMYALNSNTNAICVLEDVDSIEVLKARPNLQRLAEQAAKRSSSSEGGLVDRAEASGASVTSAGRSVQTEAGKGLTLSGFLNAIDGVGAAEGRILFMTSNTPEELDPALLRPGRLDRKYVLGPAGAAEARAMFARFFPDQDADAFVRMIAPRLPLTQAELQNDLLALVAQESPARVLQEELARAAA